MCLWIGRLILVGCPYYPKWSTESMQSLLKSQRDIFTDIEKFIWNLKGPWIAKTTLKNKNLEIAHFLISKLITKLQWSEQCGAGINTDI